MAEDKKDIVSELEENYKEGTKEDYKQANATLKFLSKKIKIEKTGVKKAAEIFKEIRPDKNSVKVNDTTIKWNVDPKPKLGKLIQGESFEEIFAKAKVTVSIDSKIDDMTSLKISVNGEPFRMQKDGTMGKCDAKFMFTKKF